MTFDLDDTFYDNWPIIMRAEQSLMKFIAQNYPLAKSISSTYWLSFKAEALRQIRIQTRHGQVAPSFFTFGLSKCRLSG